jgi:glycogen debranching enzyme
MDTDWKNDAREGARIEIQALFLAALRLLRKIDKADPFEKELARKVRKEFFDGKILADGAGDKTIRPNVFIAAYAYPELLTKKEWIMCFESMLPKIWLSWGGLSSIGKSSPLFTSHNTGESAESYHRGDSWFWINNLAAIVLHRLDKDRFKKYIDKILKASIKEMLYMGVTGYSAELSSAAELKSQGCFCQAWSSAMFIELIDEIYG